MMKRAVAPALHLPTGSRTLACKAMRISDAGRRATFILSKNDAKHGRSSIRMRGGPPIAAHEHARAWLAVPAPKAKGLL